jgi:hypothetical protein
LRGVSAGLPGTVQGVAYRVLDFLEWNRSPTVSDTIAQQANDLAGGAVRVKLTGNLE